MPTPAVGIDLGTTNSVVAVSLNGKPQVLVDSLSGSSLIPSVVSFAETGERIVGRAARVRKAFDPANTISSVKRLLGRPFKSEEVRRARSRVAFELKEGADSAVLVQTRGGSFSLPEISAMVLREVRRVAEESLEQKVDRCVVTVPANFNELQRSSTKIAGKIAELEVVRILNEPTAAALAYGYGRGSREKICIYDFGGGTFDVTLLELNGNVFEVLSTWGDTFLGGDDIDMAITDSLVVPLQKATRIDASSDRLAYDILRDAAEAVKCKLSSADNATLDFNYMAPGARAPVRFQHNLTRGEFDRLAGAHVEKTFAVCQEALKLAGLRTSDLTSVILVGGSTRIPSVRARVAQFFGRDPLTHLPPEEVVGLGAAILAEALTGGVRKGPTTQRMFASGEPVPSPGGSNAGPLPSPSAPPPSASAPPGAMSPFRASTLVGNPPAAPPARPATATSPFRAQTPPPLPPGARTAPPPVPSQAERRSEAPPPPVPAKAAPPAMPASPRSPAPVNFDLDDPFSTEGSRPSNVPFTSAKPTPMPTQGPGITNLDEPSFVGRNPVGARPSNTRPYEQPVPAFNLDDPSVSIPLASLASTIQQGARGEMPADEERTQTRDGRALLAGLGAALPAVAQPGLPAPAPELPANAAELPSQIKAPPPPFQMSPPQAPPLVKPPIGAAPRPSSPAIQTVSAKPALGAPPRSSSPNVSPITEEGPRPSGLSAALSALPPSIAAAIKPPPPRAEPAMFSASDEDTRAVNTLDERSVPSFNLDASIFGDDSAVFGDHAKPPQGGPHSIDVSVPSFRIDADDIFGPSGEPGTGTLVAKSPFEPTLPEFGSSTVALEAPPQPPSFALDDETSTRNVGLVAAVAVAAAAAMPSPDEQTRAMPTAPDADDASLPPMVVPAPMKAAVPIVRPAAPAPSMTSTLQGGPQAGGDTLGPGLPPARPNAPASANPPPAPMRGSTVPPAQTASAAPPPRPSAPVGGIAVPLLLDVTPLSLGVETAGGLCETVIRRNATIPVEQTRIFATTNDDQTTVVIRIAQGESRKFSENQGLGELELTGLRAAPRGEVSVAVTFELGADGTLNVRARDVETNREQTTRVSLLTIPTETAQAEMAARQRASLPTAAS